MDKVFLDQIGPAIKAVYICKLLHDSGRLELFLSSGVEDADEGSEYELIRYGLDVVMDQCWSRLSHDDDYGYGIETLYFSDPVIMEYYRLCRVYGARHHVKLAENPYMLEAKDFVDDHLDQGCPVCEYRLQTKINHEWASGIVFRMWPEFEWHFALLTQMDAIRCFYVRQLEKLKRELEIPNDENWKEAA